MDSNAWVVSADMGYGHQRASFPLKDIAYERVVTANSDKIVTEYEKKLWNASRASYEWISRVYSIPVIGKTLFNIFDQLQSIASLYPLRDMSRPTLGVWYLHTLIKRGLGKSLVDYTKKNSLPFIATFPIPALSADYYGREDVFCVVTDIDINRAWVAYDPKKSRIKYLAPTEYTVKRLKQYGVPADRIFLTGFPLPKENIGDVSKSILKRDLGGRLPNLDPKRKCLTTLQSIIRKNLGPSNYREKSSHPFTLTFMIGGAGAQKDIGEKILKSFKKKILSHEVRVNIVTGTRLLLLQHFKEYAHYIGLEGEIGDGVRLIHGLSKKLYFLDLCEALHTTDVLWTKPSEMSFYAGLGIPIIIAPPIGSHERYNKKWLEENGVGIPQGDPEYASEWLMDLVESGRLSELAWEGYMKVPHMGAYNIQDIVFKNSKNKRGK